MSSSEQMIRDLTRSDPVLARLIRKVGPFRLKPDRTQAPYAALIRSVIYQQLNGRAAKTIFERVKALYPDKKFPEPADILATSDERLRSAGLSRMKISYLRDIAVKALDGSIPSPRAIRAMSDDQIVEALTGIRGVGRWTVEMLLIFQLGRPDVLPVTDYAIRKSFARVYGLRELPAPEQVLERGERWRPFRTAASWYLWRALELPGAEKD